MSACCETGCENAPLAPGGYCDEHAISEAELTEGLRAMGFSVVDGVVDLDDRMREEKT